jgi:hypothetical protein
MMNGSSDHGHRKTTRYDPDSSWLQGGPSPDREEEATPQISEKPAPPLIWMGWKTSPPPYRLEESSPQMRTRGRNSSSPPLSLLCHPSSIAEQSVNVTNGSDIPESVNYTKLWLNMNRSLPPFYLRFLLFRKMMFMKNSTVESVFVCVVGIEAL